MKKTLRFALIGIILLFASNSFAVGTVAITKSTTFVVNEPTRIVLTLSWVADATAATVPSTTINALTYGFSGWYLYSAETNPGSTAPTDNYDIVLNDVDGGDVAGALLANRHTTTTQLVNLGTAIPIVRGNLEFVLTNNLVNSATGTLILIFLAN